MGTSKHNIHTKNYFEEKNLKRKIKSYKQMILMLSHQCCPLKLPKTQTLSPLQNVISTYWPLCILKSQHQIFLPWHWTSKCEVQGLTNLNILRVMKWTVSTSIWLLSIVIQLHKDCYTIKTHSLLVRKFNSYKWITYVPISKHISQCMKILTAVNDIIKSREKSIFLNPLNSIRTHISELW